jgi:hypothetical protein
MDRTRAYIINVMMKRRSFFGLIVGAIVAPFLPKRNVWKPNCNLNSNYPFRVQYENVNGKSGFTSPVSVGVDHARPGADCTARVEYTVLKNGQLITHVEHIRV